VPIDWSGLMPPSPTCTLSKIFTVHKIIRMVEGALVLALLLLVPLSRAQSAKEKPKHDKFHGSVVNAGPKSITVKSEDNIYLVRTFDYSPQVEEKIKKKKPVPGRKVTIHYLRGTDVATKVD